MLLTKLYTPHIQDLSMQPMDSTTPQVSDDGYWMLVDGNWVPTQLQNDALSKGAIPHDQKQGLDLGNQTQGLVIISSQSKGSGKPLMIIGGIAAGIVLLIALSSVLYVWASSLAEDEYIRLDPELIGDWTNPEDKLELKKNGDVTESTGTFETWYTKSGDIYFEEGIYYYKFKYLLDDDILFLAPYDEDGELSEGDCIAYLEGLNGESESYFNDKIEQAQADGRFPEWCSS